MKRYNFRLTERESNTFEEQRDVTGLSASEYIRRRVLGFRIVSKVEIKVLSELRRLGGLLKRVHEETLGMYNRDTAKAIQAIESYVRMLERLITNDRKGTSGEEG